MFFSAGVPSSGAIHIAQDCHGGIAAIDADDASARVGTRAAEIDALHWSSGGQATAPHVGRQALALKDVSTRQANFLLNVGRSKHLCIHNSVVQIAAKAAYGAQRQISHLVPPFVPTTRRKGIRYILREDAHGVHTRGNYAGVMHALKVKFAPEVI